MASCAPSEDSDQLPIQTCTAVTDDMYSYTERDEFTSEVNKVEIKNIPRFCGYAQLKLFFNRYKLTPIKIKIVRSRPKESFAFATFQTSEEKQLAIERVNGEVLKGQKLILKPARPRTDPIYMKPPPISADQPLPVPSKEEQTDSMLRAVTPLWDVSYQEQLKRKLTEVKKSLNKIQQQLITSAACNTQYCPLSDIIASPIILGYRNKSEFTCGTYLDGRRCLGFRLGAYKEGSWTVAPPHGCIHIPKDVLRLVEICNQFILNSKLEVFDPRNHSGNWKQITVRSNQAQEHMVIIQIHTQGLSREQVREECDNLCQHLYSTARPELRISSVYYQLCESMSIGGRSGEMELLRGDTKLSEKLLGVQFSISPNAFFQVNTQAAELLYDVILQNVPSGEHTVLLDLCCGAGTIGLCLASHVDKVIGIEISQEAIEDAKDNAKQNNIVNTEFICGAVEHKLDLLDEIYINTKQVIAVLDPPRAGVPSSVIRTLRKAKNVKRLIYLACSVSKASQNLVDICRPASTRMTGQPFRPARGIPVDLFPHTLHCELVLCYDHIV
ncbi:tRNA (uracil-5-)-methyltransferase-like protein A-like isoform X1 [Oopsacas minuta]|uniref:tRNA (uracil(54)-C(5))-methyltransferase n=1 Tax=Oopsacas minuta TaxID=111878 RepID=A0AAV7K036_9METZ|nr:tRNA (uracil-5-)-methyltransferase-like protein A-like isoform X1 [Oopsacas minuta]